MCGLRWLKVIQREVADRLAIRTRLRKMTMAVVPGDVVRIRMAKKNNVERRYSSEYLSAFRESMALLKSKRQVTK